MAWWWQIPDGGKNFAVSTDASRIAWQDGADIYRSTKLHVMNLETGKKDEISSRIRP